MTRSSMVVSGTALAGLLVASVVASPAQAADSAFSITGGVEFSSGDYGGQESIEEYYVPLTVAWFAPRFTLRLTVPYLSVSAPEGTVVEGPDGQPVIGEGPVTTESGLGDVIGSLTIHDVLVLSGGDFAMDLTGEVKFGTADEAKGLGTGQTDFSVQADLYRFFDRLTLIGSAGYLVRGSPDDADIGDSFFASIGGSYAVTDRTRLGLFYDYGESSFAGNDALQELTATFSARTGNRWWTHGYLSAGFSDSSPEWGVGLSFTAGF